MSFNPAAKAQNKDDFRFFGMFGFFGMFVWWII